MRVLHEASFQDDATRILRTVRYAARLAFAHPDGSRARYESPLPPELATALAAL